MDPHQRLPRRGYWFWQLTQLYAADPAQLLRQSYSHGSQPPHLVLPGQGHRIRRSVLERCLRSGPSKAQDGVFCRVGDLLGECAAKFTSLGE
jgi:hypothetical protein